MYPEEISSSIPIGIEEFFRQEEGGVARVVLAAYLLLAGALHVRGVAPDDGDGIIPPEDELQEAGIRRGTGELVAPGELILSEYDRADGDLADLVASANESGNPFEAARAVACGTRSDDELIRVCALGSAVEFFAPWTLDLPAQIAWFFLYARQMQTIELLLTLLARVGSSVIAAPTPPAPAAPPSLAIGLIAVHGTVLPLSIMSPNRPDWSVPPDGPLFKYLTGIRPDIYNKPDYYRWEGGYKDYAREVAIWNLFNWIDQRKLHGIDVVAHSHRCNVVMGSTLKGASYRKMVLMNCPVHWKKYYLSASAITKEVSSVRIKFDLVILMDRGGQRFPRNTISEHVIPRWYTGHGATTKPKTWEREKLYGYLQ